MQIGIVFNPRSGSRTGVRLHRMINAAIVGSGHVPLILDVERYERLEDRLGVMIHEADVIAVIGGDGTLNGVVNGILSSDRPDAPIAFIPAGRGKDTARAVASFSLDTLGKQRIDWTHQRTIDAGLAVTEDGRSRYFINISNLGLSSAAAELVARMPRQLGSFSYTLAAIRAFVGTTPGTARVILDDSEEFELKALLTLAACNGKAFGGGIYIAPEADIDDGKLQLVAVRHANVLDLVRNLPKLKSGAPFEHAALTRWNARTIRVEQTTLAPMDLDGEMWGAGPVTWSVVPSALTWIGPRQ